ncbi:MAG: UMP kinase, partial [Planctomycetota bacterium]
MQKVKYQRVVLKISGESFCRPNVGGIDVGVSGFIADEIKAASQLGIQLAVVVGGGNIVRGRQFEKLGINIATADYMGMVATVVNALALQDILEKKGAQT